MLAWWDSFGIYKRLRQSASGRPLWILHDGPPYANGNIHLGTMLNKVLKDVIVKSRSMLGFNAVYVPGWDCHGLPIEHQVDKELGLDKPGVDVRRAMDPVEKRRRCREYALRFIDIQRGEFKRLGVFGDWENPYVTMDPAYQAVIAREFGRFVGRGLVYKGLKPEEIGARLDTETDLLRLPQVFHTAIGVAFSPELQEFGEESSVVAHAFEGATYTDENEIVWLVAKIESKLDEIQVLKGELPMEVSDLEDEITGLHARQTRVEEEINGINEFINQKKELIKESDALVKKYEKQSTNVKNSREFEAINKEIEMQQLEVKLAEKHIKDANEEIAEKAILLEKAKKALSRISVRNGAMLRICERRKAPMPLGL